MDVILNTNLVRRRYDANTEKVAKDIKLSWLFFVVGTTFGIMISWILPRIPQKIFGIDPKSLAICFQIIFVVLIFTQIEALLGFFKKGSAKT